MNGDRLGERGEFGREDCGVIEQPLKKDAAGGVLGAHAE